MNANKNVYDTTIRLNQLTIDMSQYPEGYYRLYVSVAGYTLYENIVVTK
jgi:hypothetical protein